MWCVPRLTMPYIERMEDILDLYAKPYNPQRPMVCFDEKSKQLLAPKRPSLLMRPGRVERFDYEYVRCGTGNLFLFVEPKAGLRYVRVTRHRKQPDVAQCLQWLVDEWYPGIAMIDVVLDNLNTHFPKSLIEWLGAREAARILSRLVFHYTPTHASWLNRAEIEIGIMDQQCLDRRIADQPTLVNELAAWEKERNAARKKIIWTFTKQDALEKFGHYYPAELKKQGTSYGDPIRGGDILSYQFYKSHARLLPLPLTFTDDLKIRIRSVPNAPYSRHKRNLKAGSR